MTEIDSKVISSLRFPLTVMVVAIHSFIAIEGWSYETVANQNIGSNTAQFFIISMSHVFTHIAVPTFFLISGYLFFNNFEDGNKYVWKRKMLSRARTLLLPYILWIILYILYSMLIDYKHVLQDGIMGWLDSHAGISLFWCSETWNLDRVDLWGQPNYATAPFLVPFWFMRDLLVCVIISPIFWMLFRARSPKWLLITGLILISILYFTQTSLRIPGFTSLSFFYFGMGAMLALRNKSLVEFFSHKKRLAWCLYFALLITEIVLDGHNTFMGNIIYPFYVCIGVWSLIALKPTNWKGQKYTFFIFASHIFVLPIIGIILTKALSHLFGVGAINTIEFADHYPLIIISEFCLKIIITVFVCMVGYNIFNKVCPKICRILCGR